MKDKILLAVVRLLMSALSKDAVYDVQHECLRSLGEA
jgi:hypothetical protein